MQAYKGPEAYFLIGALAAGLATWTLASGWIIPGAVAVFVTVITLGIALARISVKP